jgi:hypothetical protein
MMRFRYKVSFLVPRRVRGHAPRWAAILPLLALCFGPAVVVAGPIATIESGPGHLKHAALCQFEDDSMTLIVNEDGKELARHYFCSSYGKASARIIQDASGESFVLLTYGEGRGTNATTEYLAVYPVAKDLVEYARIPVSAGAGPLSRWHYDSRVEKPERGGIRLVLTLRVEGGDATWLPSERTRVIEVGKDRR